jgi:hypothetical protein
MQGLVNGGSAEMSRHSRNEPLIPTDARSAGSSAPVRVVAPLAPKGLAPGLVIPTHLKAGVDKASPKLF